MEPEFKMELEGLAKTLRVPTAADSIEKDECSFTFDTPLCAKGLYTNLLTLQSYNAEYVEKDSTRTGNRLYLHQKFYRVPKEEDADAPPAKSEPVTKMALGMEGGFQVEADKYEVKKEYHLFVLPQRSMIPIDNPDIPERLREALNAVIKFDSAATKEQVTRWEEKLEETVHSDNLVQLEATQNIPLGEAKCEGCELTTNLWFNLSDGYIGCGRRNWDGSGGNNHAVEHYEETGKKYPLSVKLGTITSKGADIYSYSEDSMVRKRAMGQDAPTSHVPSSHSLNRHPGH